MIIMQGGLQETDDQSAKIVLQLGEDFAKKTLVEQMKRLRALGGEAGANEAAYKDRRKWAPPAEHLKLEELFPLCFLDTGEDLTVEPVVIRLRKATGKYVEATGNDRLWYNKAAKAASEDDQARCQARLHQIEGDDPLNPTINFVSWNLRHFPKGHPAEKWAINKLIALCHHSNVYVSIGGLDTTKPLLPQFKLAAADLMKIDVEQELKTGHDDKEHSPFVDGHKNRDQARSMLSFLLRAGTTHVKEDSPHGVLPEFFRTSDDHRDFYHAVNHWGSQAAAVCQYLGRATNLQARENDTVDYPIEGPLQTFNPLKQWANLWKGPTPNGDRAYLHVSSFVELTLNGAAGCYQHLIHIKNHHPPLNVQVQALEPKESWSYPLDLTGDYPSEFTATGIDVECGLDFFENWTERLPQMRRQELMLRPQKVHDQPCTLPLSDQVTQATIQDAQLRMQRYGIVEDQTYRDMVDMVKQGTAYCKIAAANSGP